MLQVCAGMISLVEPIPNFQICIFLEFCIELPW
jgi:hypothetical protein